MKTTGVAVQATQAHRGGGEAKKLKRSAPRLSLLLLLIFGLVACAKKTPTLKLLVWEGYADPSFGRGFEEQHKCKVSGSYMGTSDELVSKLRGGSASNYDVIWPSSDVATRAEGWLERAAELVDAPVLRNK